MIRDRTLTGRWRQRLDMGPEWTFSPTVGWLVAVVFVFAGSTSSVVPTAGTGLILTGIYFNLFSKDKGF